MDAMAEAYSNNTPYGFALDNPILFNDPSGLASETGLTEETAKELAGVTVYSTPKNRFNFTSWGLWVDMNKKYDRNQLSSYLKSAGVNENGMRLFNLAYDGIGYRERLAEIEAGWRSFVEEALLEGATWIGGGLVIKIGGKLVKVGYRAYKAYKYAKEVNAGTTALDT